MTAKLVKTSYTAVVEVRGGREGHARSSDGNLDVTLQPPAQVGKRSGSTNPEQLFAAGYAACFQSALLGAASGAGHNAVNSVITSSVSLGQTDSGEFGLAVALDITIPGVDQATAEAIAAEAHQTCPYSNATRGNIEVTITAHGD